MSRLFGLAALALLMALMLYLPQPELGGVPLSMTLGFLLLAGFGGGKLGNRVGLPGITGYLVAGVILGPDCFGLLSRTDLVDLRLINSFAIALIALTAGGEVNLARIRRSLKAFSIITSCQVGTVFLGVMAAMTLVLSFFRELMPPGLSGILAFASLMAVIAIVTSPNATVAVIVESRARGRMSELVLGITVLKDIIVVICFSLMLGLAVTWLGAETVAAAHPQAGLYWELGGSVLVGALIGLAIIAYIAWLEAEMPLFIIAVSFIAVQLADFMQLHSLLVCMVAGLVVSNFSSRGPVFIQAIEKSSLPVYVLFFAISGADIEFEVLGRAWQIMLAFVACRMFFIWLGTGFGAKLAAEKLLLRRYLWMGYVSQTGVALSMALIVAATFPGWGDVFRNVLVGSIVVFEMVGPVLFKFGLGRAGEIPPAGRNS